MFGGTMSRRWRGTRIVCRACGWKGYRRGWECICYEDWAMYCRPLSPGPGCSRGIDWPCPKCEGMKFDYLPSREEMRNDAHVKRLLEEMEKQGEIPLHKSTDSARLGRE